MLEQVNHQQYMRAEPQVRQIGDQQILFTIQQQQLHIVLKTTPAAACETTIYQRQLPPSFTNIFDSIQELAHFLRNADDTAFSKLANDQLTLAVPRIFGPSRAITIPMTEIPQLSLEGEVAKIKDGQLALSHRVQSMQEQLHRLERLFHEEIPRQIQSRFESYQLPHQSHPIPRLHSETGKRMDEEKKLQAGQKGVGVRGSGAGVGSSGGVWGRELKFEVDESNKFLADYFQREGNHIWKKREDEDIYQVYSSVHFPHEGRHVVHFRINTITDGMMWFGLITENKRHEQYIGDEPEAVFLSGQGSKSFTIAGRKSHLDLPPFHSNTLVSIAVEVPTRKVRFYVGGVREPVVGARLPGCMVGKKVYPFFQIFVNGDGVTINP